MAVQPPPCFFCTARPRDRQRQVMQTSQMRSFKLGPKSIERSPAVGDFYGTRIEIWAGFGLVGITEKIGLIMSNF